MEYAVVGNLLVMSDSLMKVSEEELKRDNQPILDSIKTRSSITDIQGPLTVEEATKLLNMQDTVFSIDYITLLQETNGFKINNWDFYGTNIRRLVLPQVTYLVVAEDDPLSLCFVEGDVTGRIVEYDQIMENEVDMGSEFIPALVKVSTDNPT